MIDNLTLKQTGVKQEFSTGSVRDSGSGKGRYDLISPIALRRLALRLEAGATHYGERNWEKGQNLSRYLESALRHLLGHLEGKRDEDHLAAAMWNIHCVMHTEEMIDRGLLPKELDDRPMFLPVEPKAPEKKCCPICQHFNSPSRERCEVCYEDIS